MPDVLVVSDSPAVRAEVTSAIADRGTTVWELTHGAEVLAAVREKTPDVAILDLQIGKMGGMATCMELRLEEGAGRLPHVPVLMLLDRRADVFLARRSAAQGWVVKPLDPLRLARAVREVAAGGTYHDQSFLPVTTSPGQPA
ncbi:MAG TPA: response regulator transcription factor [Acidimicrobiales bacterium]|nr:response regulator transcription factor [Acidimicrobiales bacterium]